MPVPVGRALPRHFISAVKLFGLALLFAPMWGLTWHKVNANEQWTFIWARQFLSWQIAGEHWYQAITYVLAYLIALLGIFVIPFIRGSGLRTAIVLVLMTGWFVDHFFLEMNGVFTSRDLISLLWDEWHLSSDAAFAYQAPLFRNLLLATAIVVGFCIPPRKPLSLSGYWALVPGTGLIIVGCLVNYSKSAQLIFPVPYSLLATAVSLETGIKGNRPFGYYTSQHIVSDRIIDAPFQPDRRFKKILMIMDESVRGDFLSLNNAKLDNTPFLKSDTRLINFGIAISGGNCSSISRTIFRYGMRSQDLPEKWDESAKAPLIWQYAHNAGYRTIHFDGLAGPLQFHNGFTSREMSLIDAQVSVLDNPAYIRDNKIAKKVISLLRDDDAPMFLLVDKHGMHFPYELRYPDGGRPKDRLEHYRLGIAWSVDEFFRRLMAELNLSDTLMIYTSDHGQNFESGQTHCTVAKDVSPNEAKVPIFAATDNDRFEQRLRHAAKSGFNRMSHFELFPTLLIAMGYDEKWVSEAYGPSLLDEPTPHVRSFLVGNPYLNPAMIAADSVLTH
jgi:glucan phosphoethanolaminetransferase (alkaline phosphatase superfamily)